MKGFVMKTREITVRCQSGLNSRQAMYFVQKANEFESNIWLGHNEEKLNAKSLLGVMCLGLTTGANAVLFADGADDSAALDSLEQLLQRDVV